MSGAPAGESHWGLQRVPTGTAPSVELHPRALGGAAPVRVAGGQANCTRRMREVGTLDISHATACCADHPST